MTGAEVAVLLSATAAATAGAGAVMSYQGQKQAAKSESDIAEYNARLAQNEAKENEQNAMYESQQNRRKMRQVIGAQKAQVGASGAVMTGSPLLMLADTEKQMEIDNAMSLRNAVIGSNRLRQQSSLFSYQGKAAKRYGNYAAAGSLLSGGAQTAAYGANAFAT